MTDFADVEIHILPLWGAQYPVQIRLNGQQEFKGLLSADIEQWSASGDPKVDGAALFDRLLADPALQRAWGTISGQATQRRIRLYIDPEAAILHTLPWELLRDKNVVLAAHADTPFSRYLPGERPWREAVKRLPIRILVVISNPSDLEKYNLPLAKIEVEKQALDEAFATVVPGKVKVDYLEPPATLSCIEDALRDGDYQILHILSHGAFNSRTHETALYLEDADQRARRVGDSDFAAMLARKGIQPHVVVLAACQSATRTSADAFRGLAPKLIAAGVPAVVAMQDFVTVQSARLFSGEFYRRLLEHDTVDLAANEARDKLLTEDRHDAAVPVLFMRLQDGRLWQAPSSRSMELNAFHQLPAPPLDFVGRTTELNAILNHLQHGAVITGLRGLGGIGKTTLALVIAERMKDQYPDAQFYIDLHGASDHPLSPAEALAHVIRAYHPTAKLPEGEAELRGLYCSMLNDQRAIILLDDARDAAQVRPLLPPARSACLLFITSRQHFALPGLHATDLDTLPAEDARKLLLEIAPHLDRVIPSREAARNLLANHPEILRRLTTAQNDTVQVVDVIAYFCGYLPQALRAAGSLLAVALDLNPLDYAAQLRDERTRLERLGVDPAIGVSVEASLNLSYALLSPEARQVFDQLSVFPASFDAAAEEVICTDEGHKHLSTLLQLSLAQYNTATKRYSLHDLVRLFAATRLAPSPALGEGRGEGERTAAQRRHAEYYKNILSAADDLYLQGNEAITRGLAMFDAEWPNIQTGQAWAVAHTAEDPTAAQLCDDYPDAGAYVLTLRLHQRERIRWLEAALKAVRQRKDRSAEGAHLGNLGIAYADLGETRKAIEFYEQILIIHREIGDRRGEGADLGNLGSAYYSLGETRKAIEFYEQALAVMRDIGDKRAEGSILGNLGLAYADLGETRQAIEFYEQHLVIARDIGDRRGEGNASFNMALALDELDEREKAIAHAEAALKIYEQIEDPHADMVRQRLAKWKGT